MSNDLQQARVEAAAREIWKADNTTLGVDPPESMEAWVEETEGYLELARAALAAADAVAKVPPLHRDEMEPVAANPLLRGVDLAIDRLIRRDCFTDRTLRVLDELREEITRGEVAGDE